MSQQLDGLYRVQKRDAARGSAVLVDAFQEDPVWQAVFGAEATPEQRRAAFETPIIYCCAFGEVWATSADLEGIAAWLPGRYADMPFWRLLWSGALRSGLKTGMRLGRRMEPVFRPMQADRREHMKDQPFLYLMVIGVAPASQGQGLGGRLLRALIQKSEQEQLPIYLETETEKNVGMYERFGFRVVKEITLPVVNLPMWELVRGPQHR